ncbi:UDP-2,3-diacylglucosamine diphosphatase [Viridibacterium curvum]|uniref:UDP-2,3-diacylglucosamine hydrolase n=1 Tax=Viridibacterium curvum TaxID=1101404 RepID=A0ABP9QC16_9RHOO
MIHFISDLHLHESRPETTQAFLDYLIGPARQCESLWILGDLFEAWTGDDDLSLPFSARIADALAAVAHSGVQVRILVGNRDFLLGNAFAKRSGVQIVQEPTLLQLGDHRTVLVHGDAQCTDDKRYQCFRRIVRNRLLQTIFHALPFILRRRIASRLRAQSEKSKAGKSMFIMDVNRDAIAALFKQSGAEWLIHGHTHRPAIHEHAEGTRFVLSDWQGKASGLCWNGENLSPF